MENAECLKDSYFLPEFYCLLKGLSDGIKTEPHLSEPETKMAKAEFQGGTGIPAFEPYLTPARSNKLVEGGSETWQRQFLIVAFRLCNRFSFF